MLRFDIAPVCANAYRFQAAVTLAVSAIYFFTPFKWVAVILLLGGVLRGFVSPHKCPSYKLFAAITRKMGVTKTVNAGAKMFADKLVAIMGTLMLVTWGLGSGLGNIPAVALMLFATIDLVSGFCAACWAYGLWYKVRGA